MFDTTDLLKNLKPTEKLDTILEYFVVEKNTQVSFLLLKTRFGITSGQIREILDQLMIDELIRDFENDNPLGASWMSYSLTFKGRLFHEKGGYKQQMRNEVSANRYNKLRDYILTYGTGLAGVYGLFEILKWFFHHRGWHLPF